MRTYDINTANTIPTCNGVGSQENVHRVGDNLLVAALGVLNLHRDTLLEVHNEVLRRVRGSKRVLGQLPHVAGRSRVRVLQDTGLVRAVGQVLVHTPRLRLGGGNGDALLGGVGKQIVTALEAVVEDGVAPRGVDLDIGLQGVESKLEADLVVALAGAAVRDGKAAFSLT